MKTLQKTLITLATGSLLSISASAMAYDGGFAGQPYVGVKAGQLDADLDKGDTDKATAYGIYGGYNFDPNFGVEVEYVGAQDADFNYNGVKGDVTSKTYGAYGTYRYYLPNTSFYGKGKLGIAKSDVEGKIKVGNFSYTDTQSNTGVAGGLGVGFAPTPNIGVEAEYDMVDKDTKLMSIGAHVKF